MVCGILCDCVDLWNASSVRVRLALVALCTNLHDCPGPVLRSSVTSGRDLRCFGHAKQVSCVVVESVFRVFVTQKHLIQL